jgi:hypothetical protein
LKDSDVYLAANTRPPRPEKVFDKANPVVARGTLMPLPGEVFN